MKAMDLLKQSQQEFTDSTTLGVSESIHYYYKSIGLRENVRAFVSSNIYNDKKKNVRVIESKFSSLELSEEPSENDEIIYDDAIYKVKDWEKAMGRYVIYTISKSNHTGKRVTVR